ncbi:MAG: tRNA (N6-threonylcarbamoyladenosine(37)-N6)-methyltransferase TrmO [Candidatus Thermoplasmatota archaeon]|nr:tRNA (N6-threonylcarbamoyladenosine(37)-N6)-methyltransferase TrmO [Candidatus Thermoplasmatota archaeon]
MRLKQIATVVNGLTETPDDWDRIKSKLVFEKEFVDGLFKLGHFDHIWVIFGFDRMHKTTMKVHPRHDPRKPLVGVFASRSPTRPNKLGLTLVQLIGVRQNVVTVKGLDAFDGSPVYDIKPFEEEIDY